MNRLLSISLLIAGTAFTGCHSDKKDESAFENKTDTTSSQIQTPRNDTLIKDSVMKDSVGKQKASADPNQLTN